MRLARRLRLWAAASWLAALGYGCADCAGPSVELPDASVPSDGGVDAGTLAPQPRTPEPDPFEDAGALADGGCPGAPAGPPREIASGLSDARRFAVHGGEVFVTEAGSASTDSGRVLRIPRDGGAAEALASGLRTPDAIAVDHDAVYVSADLGVWRIRKTDGEKALIDSTVNSTAVGETSLALSAGEVVFATANRYLRAFGKDGSAPRTLYHGPPGAVVRGAVVEGAFVYFLVTAGAESGLYRAPLDGGALAVRVSPEPAEGRGLALTATAYVWTEGSGGSGRARWQRRELGASAQTLASGLAAPAHPVLLGSHLYFKDSTLGAPPSAAFLKAVPLCSPPGAAFEVGPVGAGPGDLLRVDGELWFSSQAGSGDGYLKALP